MSRKLLQCSLHVEANQVAAEQAVEDLFLPGTDAERLPIRPWDVPEMAMIASGRRGLTSRGRSAK